MWHGGLSVTALAGVAAVAQVHWPGSMANKKKKKKHEKSTPKTLRRPSLSKERGPNEKKKRKNWKILNAYRGQVKGKQVRCARDGSGGT